MDVIRKVYVNGSGSEGYHQMIMYDFLNGNLTNESFFISKILFAGVLVVLVELQSTGFTTFYFGQILER